MLNTVEALGIVPSASGGAMDIDWILARWGADLVHHMTATYRVPANKIVDNSESILAGRPEREAPDVARATKRKADARGLWVTGTQAVAKRLERGHGHEEVLVALAARGRGAVGNPAQGGVDGLAVGESAT